MNVDDSAFLEAARRGNMPELQRLAAKYGRGSRPFPYSLLKDYNGCNALHLAASKGKTEACKFLLEVLNISINGIDNKGDTPLFKACWNGHWPTAEFLIDKGADLTKSNSQGANLLHCAARNGNHAFLKERLLGLELNPNCNSAVYGSPLMLALHADSIECMELLLKVGFSPNIHCPKCKTTPLCAAASKLNPQMIDLLLAQDADPNVLDATGRKAIEYAALCHFQQGVDVLLPVTLQIEGYPEWSTSGIMQNVPSENDRKLRTFKNVERSKQGTSEGNNALGNHDNEDATKRCSQAIDADSTTAEVYCNRSMSWIRLNNLRPWLWNLITNEFKRRIVRRWLKD